MNRIASVLVLIAGLVILGVGVNAANSVTSETATALTGTPTDRALWLMIGGGAVALFGLIGLIRSLSAPPHQA
jgi:TRAP-type C4-dicarboxylate transport system permease small subunit